MSKASEIIEQMSGGAGSGDEQEINEDRSVMELILPQDKVAKIMSMDLDKESTKLFRDVYMHFRKQLTLKGREEPAFNRFMNFAQRPTGGANGRNLIFKMANELGMKLPSSSF
jgi:hypothetical protein